MASAANTPPKRGFGEAAENPFGYDLVAARGRNGGTAPASAIS